MTSPTFQIVPDSVRDKFRAKSAYEGELSALEEGKTIFRPRDDSGSSAAKAIRQMIAYRTGRAKKVVMRKSLVDGVSGLAMWLVDR